MGVGASTRARFERRDDQWRCFPTEEPLNLEIHPLWIACRSALQLLRLGLAVRAQTLDFHALLVGCKARTLRLLR